jgi:hypothetical protein
MLMLNLVLALLWLLLGIGLLVTYHNTEGEQSRTYVLGLVFSFVMTAWNLLRWFLIRRAREQRRAARLETEALARRVRVQGPEPFREPDPTFDFTQNPPPVRRTDEPPGG